MGRLQSESISLHVTPEEKTAMVERMKEAVAPSMRAFILDMCMHGKEKEILATWFLREEYINAGWFKRLLLRIEFVFRDTRGESHIPQIPKHIRMEIARCLLPDIIAYYESEQGQKEFAEWKAGQEAEKKEKSEVA